MAVYEDAYILESVKKGVSYLVAKVTFDKLAIDGLWDNYKRIIKPNGAIVLTASQPFTSALTMSNPKWFKYEWIWEKDKPGNFMLAEIQPMRYHESILVFYKNQPCYNNQKTYHDNPVNMSSAKSRKKESIFGNVIKMVGRAGGNHYKNASTVIKFNTIKHNQKEYNEHPTQKPLALMEYLIRTYTNKGDLVLDNTAGSGTTGLAAQNLERQWIMIEMDEEDKYIGIIEDRMNMGRQGRMFL